MIHHTRGVYPDGSFKDKGVDSALIASHIEYNINLRPGRALIVDGWCVHKGIGVSPELIAKHKTASANIKVDNVTRPYV